MANSLDELDWEAGPIKEALAALFHAIKAQAIAEVPQFQERIADRDGQIEALRAEVQRLRGANYPVLRPRPEEELADLADELRPETD